jgi:L-aminopeptidase/D-esterase-like protein
MTPSRNLITDVQGLRVGNAHDPAVATGVTVALFDEPTVASCAVHGGAPGTRETDLLEPDKMVPGVHAIALGGGSAYGLDAAGGVQAYLREHGIGFAVGPALVPLVPQAICFDLLNGGNKDWGRHSPYRDLGYEAAARAGRDFALGTAGGGYGATTVNLKGGLGSASTVTASGHTVGALVIVNAIASAVIGDGPHFWAGGFEEGEEFGGLGWPARITPEMRQLAWKGGPQPATTIALVATDAVLTKAQAKRLAVVAHDGIARVVTLRARALRWRCGVRRCHRPPRARGRGHGPHPRTARRRDCLPGDRRGSTRPPPSVPGALPLRRLTSAPTPLGRPSLRHLRTRPREGRTGPPDRPRASRR